MHASNFRGTKSHVPFPLLRLYKSISPAWWRVFIFRNKVCFYGEDLPALRPTPKLDGHPLSAVRDCLFNIYASPLHIGGRSSIHNLRICHAVVTGTHLSWFICLYIYHNFWGCVMDRTGLELSSDGLYWAFEFHVWICLQNNWKNCILASSRLYVYPPAKRQIFHTFYFEVRLNFAEQIIKSSMDTCTIII